MTECGNIQGAYSNQDVNVGWYSYKTIKNCKLRVGPGDHFPAIVELSTNKRIGIQSVRNPRALDNPAKRSTVVDSHGKHWAWSYVFDTREVGWIRVACIDPTHPSVPWAHGPGNNDFHVGLEKCKRGVKSSCHGGRKNKVRIISKPKVRLRWAPKGTAFYWLQEGDTVRELYRRSLDDYSAVVVLRSDSVPEQTRGWVRCAVLDSEKVTGIDVSSHQGAVDFHKVKESGERFVICKATEGEGFVDPLFIQNVNASRGILEVGAYHFLRPKPGRSGRAEADDFIRALRAAKLGKGDIRPTVDIETTTLGAGETERYVGQFVGSLRMAGFDAMLYTYPAFMEWTRTFETDLWIANYSVNRPTIPEPWHDYAIWQYTDSGVVPGVQGKVDRNKCPDLARIIQH